MILVPLIVFGLVLWMVGRVLQRRSRRHLGADVVSDALGTVRPYRGKKWKVGNRWL